MKARVVFLALIVAFVGCKKDDSNNDNTTPAAEPFLKVGHEMVYEFTTSSQGVNMTGEISYKVIEDLGNGSYKIEQTTQMTGIPAQTSYDTWTKDNAFGMGKDMSTAKVGDSWTEANAGITYTTTVTSVSENVTVPAGTFTCVKLEQVQSNNTSITNNFYVHIVYGMIYSQITSQTSVGGTTVTTTSEMKLKSKNF